MQTMLLLLLLLLFYFVFVCVFFFFFVCFFFFSAQKSMEKYMGKSVPYYFTVRAATHYHTQSWQTLKQGKECFILSLNRSLPTLSLH